MREVWEQTPWVIDVETGSVVSDVAFNMRKWLVARLGKQLFPFGDKPWVGEWQFGGATVNGWTWLGFSKEADMNAFMSAFPDAVESYRI